MIECLTTLRGAAYSHGLILFLHPIRGVEDILAETKTALAPELKVWLPALFVALIADYPIKAMFGIQFSNVGYYAFAWFAAILTTIVETVFLFASLRVFRLPVSFVETRALYTFVVGYSPITSIIQWPHLIRILGVVHDVKQKAHSPTEGLQMLFAVRGQMGFPGNVFGEIASNAFEFAGYILLALLAEALIKWFGVKRVRAYVAVGLGAAFGQLISGVLNQLLGTIDIYGNIA